MPAFAWKQTGNVSFDSFSPYATWRCVTIIIILYYNDTIVFRPDGYYYYYRLLFSCTLSKYTIMQYFMLWYYCIIVNIIILISRFARASIYVKFPIAVTLYARIIKKLLLFSSANKNNNRWNNIVSVIMLRTWRNQSVIAGIFVYFIFIFNNAHALHRLLL